MPDYDALERGLRADAEHLRRNKMVDDGIHGYSEDQVIVAQAQRADAAADAIRDLRAQLAAAEAEHDGALKEVERQKEIQARYVALTDPVFERLESTHDALAAALARAEGAEGERDALREALNKRARQSGVGRDHRRRPREQAMTPAEVAELRKLAQEAMRDERLFRNASQLIALQDMHGRLSPAVVERLVLAHECLRMLITGHAGQQARARMTARELFREG